MKSKILIIRLSSLGDIILTSPLVMNLKLSNPGAEITYLCKEQFEPVVKLIPGVDQVATVANNISLIQFTILLNQLDKNNFSHIFDLHGNFRSWWVRKQITADKIFVYPKRRLERFQALLTKAKSENYPHTIDLYHQTLHDSKLPIYLKRPLIIPPPVIEDESFNNFKKHQANYIIIAPEAAHPTKEYGYDNFKQLAIRINKELNMGIVWAVTKKGASQPDPVSELGAENCFKAVGMNLDQLSRVIAGGELSLTNDSGLMHLSSAVGTPVVAMFGPTHPVLGFSPMGLFDTVLEVDEPCRPCSRHGKKACYREERFCFTKLEPERVFGRVRTFIAEDLRANRAVFIDRDGTIIKDKDYLDDPNQIEFEAGAIEGLKQIQKLGLKIVIVSNQSGVARGKFDIERVNLMNRRLLEMLLKERVEPDAIYFCPHHPQGTVDEFRTECNCRKPSAGMAENAAEQLKINLSRSFIIGDKIDDVNFGLLIGGKSFMVKTGYGNKQSSYLKNQFYKDVTLADSILDAAVHIEKQLKDGN